MKYKIPQTRNSTDTMLTVLQKESPEISLPLMWPRAFVPKVLPRGNHLRLCGGRVVSAMQNVLKKYLWVVSGSMREMVWWTMWKPPHDLPSLQLTSNLAQKLFPVFNCETGSRFWSWFFVTKRLGELCGGFYRTPSACHTLALPAGKFF